MKSLNISPKQFIIAKFLGIFLTATIGALLAVYFFSSTTLNLQGLSINIKAYPVLSGKTIIEIPPIGSLSAYTHNAPLKVYLTLERIDTDVVKEVFANNVTREQFIDELSNPKLTILIPFLLKQIIIASLGAFLLVLVLWRPGLKYSLGSGLCGALLISAIILFAVNSYDIEAFNEPEYEGVISLAPEMMTKGNELLNQLEEVQNQTELFIDNIYNLFGSIDKLPFLGNPSSDENTLSLLLVGDLHSNPLGIAFIKSLVESFDIDAIIDAGDLTDFGSPLETQFAAELRNLKVPYIFAPGNHDTPEIMAFIEKINNGTVLHGNVKTFRGITILGNPDPLAYSSEAMNEEDTRKAELIEQIEEIKIVLEDREEPVDIIVIHDPKYSQTLEGLASVVVTGHYHRHEILKGDKTVYLNPGSTGASGARGLYSETSSPYSALLLYYQPGEGPVAVDLIAYHPISGKLNIERTLLK